MMAIKRYNEFKFFSKSKSNYKQSNVFRLLYIKFLSFMIFRCNSICYFEYYCLLSFFPISSEISKNEDLLKEFALYKKFLDKLTPPVSYICLSSCKLQLFLKYWSIHYCYFTDKFFHFSLLIMECNNL